MFRVSERILLGRRRDREAARPRMVAMYLMRKLCGASYPQIGMALGGRDHSTVMSAVRRVESLIKVDVRLSGTVDKLRKLLEEAP
jgi:chromosomal replication initiator protein